MAGNGTGGMANTVAVAHCNMQLWSAMRTGSYLGVYTPDAWEIYMLHA